MSSPVHKRPRRDSAVSETGEQPPVEKASRRGCVAYLCMEFALFEGLELYSGGLGILAGDIVKTAKDLDLPMHAVGILWDEGYTCQGIDENGRTVDKYPLTDRSKMIPVEVTEPITVHVKGHAVELRAFTIDEFNDKLYLLEPKHEKDRWITKRLYQGDEESRLAQEIVLGVGAVRLFRAIGRSIDYYHFNEGHPVFAGLELIRENMQSKDSPKMTFDAAVAAVKEKCLFTTHTPVLAGNETHPVKTILEVGIKDLGFTKEQLEIIGGDPFGMTVAAFHVSCRSNAVAALHQHTAEKMWSTLKNPPSIMTITNGVHVKSWQDSKIATAAAKKGQDATDVPKSLTSDPLWEAHQEAKKELIGKVKELTGIELSMDKLLIGFARRAATYKRHSLLFHNTAANLRIKWENEEHEQAAAKDKKDGPSTEKTEKTLKSEQRHEIPENEKLICEALKKGELQVLFSGKAHPQDEGGKEQIRLIHEQGKESGNSLLYLENYNMTLGRLLTRGCDVWLNNPVRPMEASGTSGMKAAMNGVLNCSILDGWWPEGCVHGINGWQIGEGDTKEDSLEDVDLRDSALMQKVILEEVMPTYYAAEKTKWRTMMRSSINMSQWQFSAERMMSDYTKKLYKSA